MLVTRDCSNAPQVESAVTIGNFDGVHRGHRAVLSILVEQARRRRLRPVVVTFEPHPREFFVPDRAPARLTSLREKVELLGEAGVEQVHVCRFNARFSRLTPENFVDQVLIARLKTRWVMIGDDFRFGAGRAGDHALLHGMAEARGFAVERMQTLVEMGERISSTQVRQALTAGDLARAAQLLGRPYSIGGRVGRGARLGRTLGFPTANLRIKHDRPALEGIFAVQVQGLDERALQGVASLGRRPTIEDRGAAILEVHLLDFSQDIYGRRVRVVFLKKLRDEEKYVDLEILRRRIALDVEQAREFFRNQ